MKSSGASVTHTFKNAVIFLNSAAQELASFTMSEYDDISPEGPFDGITNIAYHLYVS